MGEWFGWFAFIMVLCYSGYPNKVKRLERRMKKAEKKCSGGNEMSDMINALKGKKCVIKFSDSFDDFFNDKVACEVIDTDSEWVKISYQQKKKKEEEKVITRLVRIENIESVELEEL